MYRWSDYYEEAKAAYEKENGKPKQVLDLYDLTMRVHDPDSRKSTDILEFSDNYGSVIASLGERVNEALKNESLYEKQAMAYGIKDPLQFEEELKTLGDLFVPQLEEKVFGSYVQVDNVKVYRSFVTQEQAKSSWLWHFDNNIKEQIKILIYLTDVNDGDGQYEFLFNKKTREGLQVPTSRPNWDNWVFTGNANFDLNPNVNISWGGTDRVPVPIVEHCLKNGYGRAKVLGKRGKALLFDNNIIHRGTPARKKYRDVVTFQFKPSLEKIRPTVDRSTTGNGWQHTTFNVDPSIIQPLEAHEANGHRSHLQEHFQKLRSSEDA